MKTLNLTLRTVLLTLALVSSTKVYSYDFEVDGLYYNILSLQDLTVELTYGDEEYSGDIEVPDQIEYLNRVFTVTRLGDRAFQGCNSLLSLIIPQTVKTAGAYVFSYCSNLTSLTIPASMTIIGSGETSDYGKGCFAGCYNLSSITFEDSENSILLYPNDWTSGSIRTFVSCHLNSIYIGRDIECAYSQANSNRNPFYGQHSLKEIIFGEHITYIPSSMFQNCTGLEHINIPKNITSIGSYAFKGCSNLSDVNINEGVSTIGHDAFENCTSITSIFFPSTITSIGSQAFLNCTNLSKISINAITPPTINETTFPGIVFLSSILYVPIGSKSLYETAIGWQDFVHIEETDSFDNLTTYYRLTLSVSVGGSVSIGETTLSNTSFTMQLKEGDNTVLTLCPNEGYLLKSFIVNGEDLLSSVTNNSFTINPVLQDYSIDVIFTKIPEINADVNNDGEINIADVNAVIDCILKQ